MADNAWQFVIVFAAVAAAAAMLVRRGWKAVRGTGGGCGAACGGCPSAAGKSGPLVTLEMEGLSGR